MRRCCTRMSTASAPNRCSRPKSPTSSARRPCRPSSFDPKEPRMSRRPLALALALAVLLPASASAEDLLQTYELARTGDPQLAAADPWHAVVSFVGLGLLDGGDGIGAADRIPQRHPLGELIPAGLAAGHVRHPIGDGPAGHLRAVEVQARSEEHTSELQSLMRISYAVFCLKKKKQQRYEANDLK